MQQPFFTIGHGTRTIDEFVHLLQRAEVKLVVDIRTVPRSRANPQYNADVLPQNLAPFGIGYTHIVELGGLRSRSKTISATVNSFWENQSFHNYADYAMSADFGAALHRLVELGRAQRLALMCAESVWWRCHRRIVADYLIVRSETVFHLMDHDRIEPATMTPEAVRQADGTLAYPPQPGD
ncbi:uncharacterized protein (DUF488 family) [Mesorhizobium soli]|jgi:uncharacterized protein (DUF488 family)|uniref:DUF488 domain-containing protein n=1 Tax=Pseudaminobacter soli (ex Li et al. 2025) TaxID=1295366 RepID=UPI002475E281|nr:DUF488 domain-containing protein [Mesorhizobium soli]MDH6231066.1 uncharacterized protein (DUF488 family) [Mesorhizobium soli]